MGMRCNPSTLACEAVGYDFFVDATRVGTGIGTALDPFRTITEALDEAALLEGQPRRVSVGPGFYDESLGERFPLRIPGDVSLEGAGSEQTVISGVGLSGEDFGGEFMATIVVGDNEFVSRIANLALRPGPAVAPVNTYGVFCNRGNGPREREQTRPPNTLLHGLDIAAYVAAVRVTHSMFRGEPGCNLALTSSTISAGTLGIWGEACPDWSRERHVAIQVGDGTPEGGNEFKDFRLLDTMGTGIHVDACTRISATYNYFHASNIGISMHGSAHSVPGTDHTIIENNRFEDLNGAGVYLFGGVEVDSLSNNRFEHILTDLHQSAPRAPGLLLEANGTDLLHASGEPFPKIVRARNNSFLHNDVAVQIRGEARPLTLARVSDFGTPDDPGGNVFSCNSTRGTWPFAGADVRLDVPNADGVMLLFSGNVWDHNPPTTIRTSEPEDQTSEPTEGNGADVSMSSTNQVQLDTSDASLTPDTCADDWIP